MSSFIDRLYHNKLISRVFHTSVYCLKRELRDCTSVLDLGCGPDSPIKYCAVSHSLGVDTFESYMEESRRNKIHDEYMCEDITRLDFESKSFDAVILIGVLEHLKKNEGEQLLAKVELWAKKKVVVSMPNGYLPQANIDNNPFQCHRSGWTPNELKQKDYQTYGMAGWKFLRKENTSKSIKDEGDIFSTIRFRPRGFWLIVSELTQLITYFFPKLAFETFCVKRL